MGRFHTFSLSGGLFFNRWSDKARRFGIAAMDSTQAAGSCSRSEVFLLQRKSFAIVHIICLHKFSLCREPAIPGGFEEKLPFRYNGGRLYHTRVQRTPCRGTLTDLGLASTGTLKSAGPRNDLFSGTNKKLTISHSRYFLNARSPPYPAPPSISCKPSYALPPSHSA